MSIDSRCRHQIRLLTFSHLPLPYFNQPEESWFEAVCELTSQSCFYEQHYLQQSGWHSLLKSVSKDMASCVELTVLGDGPDAEFGLSYAEIAALQEWSSTPGAGIDWLHVENGTSWPSNFLEAVNAIWSSDPSQCPLVITALNGCQQDFSNMESALEESQIRVPLWVVDGTPAIRSQRLTGSLQLLPALIEAACNETPQPTPLQLPTCDAVIIECRDRRAVRTTDFLYVDTGLQEALYAKPMDCWNTNDVSRELFDVVDEMALLLKRRAIQSD